MTHSMDVLSMEHSTFLTVSPLSAVPLSQAAISQELSIFMKMSLL